MPKIPINYENTIIYKLIHKDDFENNNIYIGSTTDFIRRKTKHKYDCNDIKGAGYNSKKYQYIRNNGGWDEWDMIEIEKYPCNDGNEARAREEYWKCYFNAQLNSISAYLTDAQKKINCNRHNKEYYYDKRDAVLKRRKEYYIINRDKILEHKKNYYDANKYNISIKNKARYIIKKHTNNYYSKIKNENEPICASCCCAGMPAQPPLV